MNRRPIDKDTLEAIIDHHCLTTVVEMLSEICAEKAEHILMNWDDKASPIAGTRAARSSIRWLPSCRKCGEAT
jgi:hypothetical protein